MIFSLTGGDKFNNLTTADRFYGAARRGESTVISPPRSPKEWERRPVLPARQRKPENDARQRASFRPPRLVESRDPWYRNQRPSSCLAPFDRSRSSRVVDRETLKKNCTLLAESVEHQIFNRCISCNRV